MNAMVRIDPIGVEPLNAAAEEQWSGRPAWRSAAIRIWKVRIVAIYFTVLLADGLRLAFSATGGRAEALLGDAKLLAAAAVVLGGLTLLAWLTRRTTLYTIDDRAVTLRYGIALQATLVIPLGAIEHVGIRIHRDQTGDVALRLKPGQRVIYPKLWPHARPWKILRPEPMLRCIPDAGVAGAFLCRAMGRSDETRRWKDQSMNALRSSRSDDQTGVLNQII